MKPALARYALAVALIGSTAAAFIGLVLARHGSTDGIVGRVLFWVLALVALAQVGPAVGYAFAPGALQKGVLPAWSRGKKRAFTAWAIFATPTAIAGLVVALALLIFSGSF